MSVRPNRKAPVVTEETCRACEGRGWRFALPADVNPFYVRLPALERMMQKVTCRECRGAFDRLEEVAAALNRGERPPGVMVDGPRQRKPR